MILDRAVAAAGVRLLAFDTIGSTNAQALAQARKGDRGPLWITAARQTEGRGRRGRSFVSERGNLYATLLVTDASPAEHAAELAFVAALALHDAVCEAAAVLAARLALKWPNDLLCDGAKVAGILVEGESGIGRPLVTVVGIGVNCAHHPKTTDYPATDLLTAGGSVSPETLFAALSRAMHQRLQEWEGGRGFAATRAAWLARAAGLGKPVRVQLSERQLEGRFQTLDPSGRLVLRLADGSVEIITVGDVFPIEEKEAATPPGVCGAPPGGSPREAAGGLTREPPPPIDGEGSRTQD